jgi:hypothetical protein
MFKARADINFSCPREQPPHLKKLIVSSSSFFSGSIVFYVSYLHWLWATHTGDVIGMGFLDCFLGPQ